MSSTDQHEEFVERAHENQLKISRSDAEEIGSFSESVAAAYSTIRNIDTTGFEPAAVFVPTPSERESD